MGRRDIPNRSQLLACGLVWILLFWTIGAQAQKGRVNTNSAPAVLHIQVTVVPMVYSPSPKIETYPKNSVTYHFPSLNVPQEVIIRESAVRELAPDSLCRGESCNAMLRTTTIVAR